MLKKGKGDPLDRVQHKLSECQGGLRRWRALEDKNISQTIKIKSNKLKLLQEHEDPTSLKEII